VNGKKKLDAGDSEKGKIMTTLREEIAPGMSSGPETEPFKRLRRMRMTDAFRSMVRETELSRNDFIYPLFVVPGKKIRNEINPCRGYSNYRLMRR